MSTNEARKQLQQYVWDRNCETGADVDVQFEIDDLSPLVACGEITIERAKTNLEAYYAEVEA